MATYLVVGRTNGSLARSFASLEEAIAFASAQRAESACDIHLSSGAVAWTWEMGKPTSHGETHMPFTYTAETGWAGGDDRTLYAVTDKRTGRVTVRPAYLFAGVGPEVTIAVATRSQAEADWQAPLHAGWKVVE